MLAPRFEEICALAQSVIELHWKQQSESIFWRDKFSIAARLAFKAVAVVSKVAVAARHVCGEIMCGRILWKGGWKQSRISETVSQWRAWAEKAPAGWATLAHAWTKATVA